MTNIAWTWTYLSLPGRYCAHLETVSLSCLSPYILYTIKKYTKSAIYNEVKIQFWFLLVVVVGVSMFVVVLLFVAAHIEFSCGQ